MESLARYSDPEIVVDKLLELYRQAGELEYHGERVSQLEHALRTAQQAACALGSLSSSSRIRSMTRVKGSILGHG